MLSQISSPYAKLTLHTYEMRKITSLKVMVIFLSTYLGDVEFLFDDGVQTKAQSKSQVAWLHTDLRDKAKEIGQ